MSLSNLYTIASVKVDPDDLAGAVQLGGITRDNLRSGTEVRTEATSGAVYAYFQELFNASPMASFATYALGTALDACSFTGLRISAASLTGLTLYGHAKAEGGRRKSGSNHVSFNLKEGLMIPRRLRLPHRGPATLDYEVLITWDGTNDWVLMTESVALPTDPGDSLRYAIGPIQLGTSTGDKVVLAGNTDVEVDFGIRAYAEASDGDIAPTMAGIEEILPSISITTFDVAKLKSSGGVKLQGKQIDTSHTVIFARKKAAAGATATGFVADGTAEHISLVPFAGCAYHDQIIDGQSGGHRTATLIIPLIGDATNPPLTIDTTAAIALPS